MGSISISVYIHECNSNLLPLKSSNAPEKNIKLPINRYFFLKLMNF